MRRRTLLVLLAARVASAEIIGAAFLPHGDFAFDPSLVNFENMLAGAARRGGERRRAARGRAARRRCSRRRTARARTCPSSSSTRQRADGYATVGLDLDRDCACGCYRGDAPDRRRCAPRPTSRITDRRAPEHRLVVPRRGARGVRRHRARAAAVGRGHVEFLNATLGSTSLVVLGQTARRQTEEVAMVPELLSLGRALFESLDALSARVLVVVSGDLAHTHLASGPYGYNPAAVPFDAALGAWASCLDPAPLLENATALADDAKSCGFTGAVMLHGLLNASWRLGAAAPAPARRRRRTAAPMVAAPARRPRRRRRRPPRPARSGGFPRPCLPGAITGRVCRVSRRRTCGRPPGPPRACARGKNVLAEGIDSCWWFHDAARASPRTSCALSLKLPAAEPLHPSGSRGCAPCGDQARAPAPNACGKKTAPSVAQDPPARASYQPAEHARAAGGAGGAHSAAGRAPHAARSRRARDGRARLPPRWQ